MSTYKTIEERTEEYLGLPLSSRQSHVDWLHTQFQELEAEKQRAVKEELEAIMKVDIGDASPTRLAIQKRLQTLTQ